jgi:hypothetical protein
LFQFSRFINHREPESIIFRLDIVIEFFWTFIFEDPIDSSLEIPHLLESIGIVEGDHRIYMGYFLELLGSEDSELRRRRVRVEHIMVRFETSERMKEYIILCIGDYRRLIDMIETIMFSDGISQGENI